MSTNIDLVNRLVAYWRLGETSGTRFDATGRGNDLTPSGSPLTLLATSPCATGANFGSASGTGRLKKTDTGDLSLGDDISFSICFWIRITTNSENGAFHTVLVGKTAAYANEEYYIALQPASSELYTHVHNDSTSGGGLTGLSLTLSTWQFVAFRYDATADLIYTSINAGTAVTQSHSGGARDGTETFAIGGFRDRTDATLPGAIANVGVWKRFLSQAELTALYASGGCLDPLSELEEDCGQVVLYNPTTGAEYVFPATFHPADESADWEITVGKTARAHGARVPPPYLRERRLLVRGGFIKGPFDRSAFRARLDSLAVALLDNPRRLYFGHRDRFYRMVRPERLGDPYGPTGYCRIAENVEIPFIAGDPFTYSALLSGDTWTAPVTGATRTITGAGHATTQPKYEFTVGGAGAQSINWTLRNQTSSESFTLAGSVVGGQVITVETLGSEDPAYPSGPYVYIGTLDRMDLFDGQWVGFRVGDNSLLLTITSGSISKIETVWRDRYL